MTFRSGKCFISDDANSTASISANRLRDPYILESQYTLTSESSENDSSISARTIPSDTTTALQSNAETSFHKERKKQLQTTKMTADLTPAPTIAARLCHLKLALLHHAAMWSLIDVLNNLNNAMCDVSFQGKHKRKCIRTKLKRATALFKIVQSHTCSRIAVPTKRGHLQYIIFVNDYTWWTTVYNLYHKKKATCIAAYQDYQAKVDRRWYNIKCHRCHGGWGECDNQLFQELLATCGTALEFCPPYGQHRNEVVERLICSMIEWTNAMIEDSQAPLEFGGKAVNTAVYLPHRMPDKGLTRRDHRNAF